MRNSRGNNGMDILAKGKRPQGGKGRERYVPVHRAYAPYKHILRIVILNDANVKNNE